MTAKGVVLSTLIGTNLFCYLSTCLVTYILLHAGATHHAAEAITTLVMTSALFIYVDIIPKTIFYYRADSLMPLLSGPLWLFHTILTRCGIISVLKGLSQGLNRLFGASADTPTALAMTGRHEVRQILHETREEGFLTPTQQDMLHALIDSQDLRVDSILIPLAKAHMLPVESDRSAVMECLRSRCRNGWPSMTKTARRSWDGSARRWWRPNTASFPMSGRSYSRSGGLPPTCRFSTPSTVWPMTTCGSRPYGIRKRPKGPKLRRWESLPFAISSSRLPQIEPPLPERKSSRPNHSASSMMALQMLLIASRV